MLVFLFRVTRTVKIEPLNLPAHICGRNAAWFIDSSIDTQVPSSARVLFRDQMMCGQRRIRAVTFNGELMRWITATNTRRVRPPPLLSRQKYLSFNVRDTFALGKRAWRIV